MIAKTITLTGTEVRTEYSGGANAWLRNDGTTVMFASAAPGVSAGSDGVIAIPSGQSAPVYGANGAVYLVGSGSVQLIGSDCFSNPFKTSASSGGSDADAVARAAIEAHAGNANIHVSADEKKSWSIYKGYVTDYDCNNADKQGVYSVSANSANAPGDGYYILVVDTAGDGDWLIQTAIPAYTRYTIFHRTRINGAWGPWSNIADGGNAYTVNGRHSGCIATRNSDGNYFSDDTENINDAYLQWDGTAYFVLKTNGGNLTMADNCDTLDGKHADDFVLKSDFAALESRIAALEK